MNEVQEKTVAELLVEEVTKIRKAMNQLLQSGIPRDVLVLMIQKKTRVGITKIREVLRAFEESLNELAQPAR